MKDPALLQISQKIKETRKSLGMTIQELADRSGVTKGLISQIENSRVVPSLLVLLQIIKALGVEINIFFGDINFYRDNPVLVIRNEELTSFEKEDADGYHYQRIFSRNVKASTIDFVLLTLEPGAQREKVVTEAFEFKHIIEGEVVYRFDSEDITLKKGDSMFFDGRLAHTPINLGSTKALMLVVYFFD
ncbi:helix-turn-helix domain-containing protein [Pedobacter sp. Hv1]|uniref:helix-turn-helix domain-containing protein n=1 Tax=Pedobacter sp. Hv1 TaxID=1740090 RepID=UPI0006D88B4F|nr:helix-turn-helix domain-containing protein [Pedobacter sp. Hv1]KQB98603.1 XRE family transcriptional regulator [Pedobacter sp. Hv1]